MPVYADPKSPYYRADIWIGGRKFSRTTKKTSRREAEAAAREIEADLRKKLKAQAEAQVSLTLDALAGRYMDDVGNRHAGAHNTARQISYLIKYFGADKRLDEITYEDVAGLVRWRRAQKPPNRKSARLISPWTVNHLTDQLRKLFAYAKKRKATFPHEPDWRDKALWMQVPRARVRELREDEEKRLLAVMRDDYAPIFEYARLTGKRQRECYDLRWLEVDFNGGQIIRDGKGGKQVTVPITDAIRTLLWPLRDHHPEFVFTYAATRTHTGRVEGKRYPITMHGLKAEWRRIRAKAGVADFRFHDFRHDFATKLLRLTGNLKLVSKALDHTSIRHTERYAHVTDTDVAEAMKRLAENRSPANKRKNLKTV